VTAPGGQTVAPGETRKILVKISTGGHGGELVKDIKVETNDPKNALISLIVKVRIFEPLKVSPRIINFGKMLPGQTATREILLENPGKKPLKVSRITGESPAPSKISASPEGPFTLKPGENRKIEVKIFTGATRGHLDCHVTLETDIPSLPQKKMYVHVEVIDRPDAP
jgi:uncharacterized membrane protein